MSHINIVSKGAGRLRKQIILIIACILTLVSCGYAYADNTEGNMQLKDAPRGTEVLLNGFKGVLVDPSNSLILLDKSIAKSFDTKERNNYEDSSIQQWLNTEFKDSLANNEWVKEGSVSLLSESEWVDYKEYLSDTVCGWLNEALRPASEPSGYDSILINNNWNYVKAIMDGELVGMGYANSYYASPITLQLNDGGYKLKNCFGKPRILIPESAETNDVGEFSSLSKGDKVRFSNKWWTLVDVGSKKLLASFDNLPNMYVSTEEEFNDIDDSSNSNNIMQFSDGITAYNSEDEYSIAHFINKDYKDTIGTDWVLSIDIPSVEQYNAWKDIINDNGWMVRNIDESGKDEVYIVDESGIVKTYPGETHPIRVVVQLVDNLYIEQRMSGLFSITGDSGLGE